MIASVGFRLRHFLKLFILYWSIVDSPAVQETQVWSLGQEDPLEKGIPTPVFLPGASHGQRSLAGYCLWGHQELDTTEQLTHTHTELINHIVLVSSEWQSDSVIYIHASILFQIVFPIRLLQNIEQSSLSCTVGTCQTSLSFESQLCQLLAMVPLDDIPNSCFIHKVRIIPDSLSWFQELNKIMHWLFSVNMYLLIVPRLAQIKTHFYHH